MAEPARAAPVPKCTIHSATEKRKGPLAPFTADRSAPRGSLGYVAGDPQLPGGTRLTLAPRPPGLPPRPARPTRGAWPVARLQAARCAPRASAGAASRSSSGPFEVEARTQGIPRDVLPRASLTERSIRRPHEAPSSANRTLPARDPSPDEAAVRDVDGLCVANRRGTASASPGCFGDPFDRSRQDLQEGLRLSSKTPKRGDRVSCPRRRRPEDRCRLRSGTRGRPDEVASG